MINTIQHSRINKIIKIQLRIKKIYFLNKNLKNEDLENEKLCLYDQYINDINSSEKYEKFNINQNICKKCNKYNKEKGFY